MKTTNKMQLCRLVYFSLAALHVSNDIFAHHQEHLNSMYSFWYYSRMSLPVAVMGEMELSGTSKNISLHNCAVGRGQADQPDHDQQHCYHHAPTVKPEAATAVVELLMMGVRTPETC